MGDHEWPAPYELQAPKKYVSPSAARELSYQTFRLAKTSSEDYESKRAAIAELMGRDWFTLAYIDAHVARNAK